jgi:hypothetical protein
MAIGGYYINDYFIGDYYINRYCWLLYCSPLVVILLAAIDGYFIGTY